MYERGSNHGSKKETEYITHALNRYLTAIQKY